MRPLRFVASLLLMAALSAVAAAQEPAAGEPPGGPPSDEAQKNAIGQFDADADGKLNEDEVGKARAFVRALRQAVGDRMGDRGDRGPRRFRPGGPPPDGPPGDGPRDRGPIGRRFDGRGPEGRGPEGGPPRRRFRDRGGDDGPPLDEAPPFEAGQRPEGPPGPGRPPRPDGPSGPPPRPMELFREFDANNDDQLSRDEFEKLAARMRPPRPPGPPPRGPEDGPRFGPPGGPPDGGRGPGPRDGQRPRREGRRGPRPGDSADAPQRPPVDEPAATSDAAT